MSRILVLLMLMEVTGCFTATVPDVRRWPVTFSGETSGANQSASPRYDSVRLVNVAVRCPYDVEGLAVLRSDGSVAFDPCNEYAATPALLFKGITLDALNASGKFAKVVPSNSTASARDSVEVEFTRLYLDCREATSRRAFCEVRIRLLNDRKLAKIVIGEGEASAAEGKYGEAFSKAVSMALMNALSHLD